METQNKQKTLKGKVGNALAIGTVGLGVLGFGTGFCLAGKNLYDEITADFKVNQSIEETEKRHLTFGSGSSIYGYDIDKDGTIDEIREHWVWYGSHAATPCEIIYHRPDKEFNGLNAVLMKE